MGDHVKMREVEDDAGAEIDIWNYVFGFVKMAVVKCAIGLGIADAIESHGSPMTLSELSTALGCEPSRLHRIMRFLTHYKIFQEEPKPKLIWTLVKAFPGIRGINFDLPHVVAVAPKSDGIENVGGDTFECVPRADAAFLMWILHDWDDKECIKILNKCREPFRKTKGKVIIVDGVLEEDKEDKLEFVRLMLNMVMMAHTKKGKERTLKEWSYVLGEAGFTRFNVKPIHAV